MSIDRIHDRVPQTQKAEHWKVTSTTKTKEEKKNKDEGERQQQRQDAFGESSDFTQLLGKDARAYQRINLARKKIDKFTFRGVSTSRENSMMEVDITLQDGSMIRGAQLSVSREVGMKMIHRKRGENIAVDPFVQGGTFLTVGIPQKSETALTEKEVKNKEDQKRQVTLPNSSTLQRYYYLAALILVLAFMAILYIAFAV